MSTTVVLMCDKIRDTHQTIRYSHDIHAVEDCIVFLDYHVTMAMSEVPTKRFAFKCSHPVKQQRCRVNHVIAVMARQSSEFIHLPEPRDRVIMTARDISCITTFESTRSIKKLDLLVTMLPHLLSTSL